MNSREKLPQGLLGQSPRYTGGPLCVRDARPSYHVPWGSMSKLPEIGKQTKLEGSSISELRHKALTSRCAKEVEEIVRSIFLSNASDTERGAALLHIGIQRDDFSHIQVRVLTTLPRVDASAARTLVDHILKQPVGPDSTHLRVTAYRALIELQGKTTADVCVLIAGLREGATEVQRSIKKALQDLPPAQLQNLKDLATKVPAGSAPLLEMIDLMLTETAVNSLRNPTAPLAALQFPAKEPRLNRPARTVESSRASDRKPERQSVPPTPPTITTPRETRDATAPLQSSVVKAHDVATPALETLRVQKFRSLNWNHLVHHLDILQDPVELCQCMAEMATRFERDMTRNVISAKLCWVVSHQDSSIKNLCAPLVEYFLAKERS